MTGLPIQPIDEELQTLQREVQRMLGRCLLRLQQYEQLMKAIVAHHELSASGSLLESNQAQRIADAASKTLGTLVGTLLGTCVASDEQEEVAEPDLPNNIISVKMKMSLRMSAEDFDRTQNDLKELVLLRNNLVHHFIDQHDLWSQDGCRGAQESLVAAYSRIDEHFEQLRGWAEHMDQARRLAAEFAQSDAFHDLVVNGIAPDDSVDWPVAGIVSALREAAGELAVEGWTPPWLPLDDGLQIGIQTNYRPSMGAVAGGRSCTNPVFSSFGIVKPMARARPGTGPERHSDKTAHFRQNTLREVPLVFSMSSVFHLNACHAQRRTNLLRERRLAAPSAPRNR